MTTCRDCRQDDREATSRESVRRIEVAVAATSITAREDNAPPVQKTQATTRATRISCTMLHGGAGGSPAAAGFQSPS